MYSKTLIMFIFAETPIHPGTGTTIFGSMDLPIQRERHTGFPIIQGSSLKGVLRKWAKNVGIVGDVNRNEKNDSWENVIFGKPDHVGGISLTDARILAFPVRSLKGVYGWITSPLVLERFRRDLVLGGMNVDFNIRSPQNDDTAFISTQSNLREGGYVFIEELQLNAVEMDDVVNGVAKYIAMGIPDDQIYDIIKEKLKRDLIIVSDNVFRDLVMLTTEVVTRIKIDEETGTVQSGGLWTEEYLPTDTIMYSLIFVPNNLDGISSDDIVKEIIKYNGKILQVGGNETIGKGFVRIKLLGEKVDSEKS